MVLFLLFTEEAEKRRGCEKKEQLKNGAGYIEQVSADAQKDLRDNALGEPCVTDASASGDPCVTDTPVTCHDVTEVLADTSATD